MVVRTLSQRDIQRPQQIAHHRAVVAHPRDKTLDGVKNIWLRSLARLRRTLEEKP